VVNAGLVRVHDLTARNCAEERLSVVSELWPANQAIVDGYAPFLPEAVGPRGEWRTPTANEFDDLLGAAGVHGEADVLIVSLPRFAGVLGHHLGCRTDYAMLHNAVRNVTFVRAIDTCIDELIPFCLSPDGLICQGAWTNPGKMQMVTHNMDLVPPRRIGLHVDNWDDLPLRERARGRRRLCVNLGLMPRYLLFLPTPLSVLASADKLPRNIPACVSPATLVRAHLGQHLQQLVARVRIDPGEAYIMNADDIIHDGASEAIDVALHFLGHFGPDHQASDDESKTTQNPHHGRLRPRRQRSSRATSG